MSFTPSQIFTDDYPPSAAAWCNESGTHHIEEIEPQDGHRRFQIVENPPVPEPEPVQTITLEQRINDLELALIEMAEAQEV